MKIVTKSMDTAFSFPPGLAWDKEVIVPCSSPAEQASFPISHCAFQRLCPLRTMLDVLHTPVLCQTGQSFHWVQVVYNLESSWTCFAQLQVLELMCPMGEPQGRTVCVLAEPFSNLVAGGVPTERMCPLETVVHISIVRLGTTLHTEKKSLHTNTVQKILNKQKKKTIVAELCRTMASPTAVNDNTRYQSNTRNSDCIAKLAYHHQHSPCKESESVRTVGPSRLLVARRAMHPKEAMQESVALSHTLPLRS
eukprot:6192069-Amphidinium_carterae.1